MLGLENMCCGILFACQAIGAAQLSQRPGKMKSGTDRMIAPPKKQIWPKITPYYIHTRLNLGRTIILKTKPRPDLRNSI